MQFDFAGMSPKQIRKVIEKAETALKYAERKEYFDSVICKFKKKYNGKWVRIKPTWSESSNTWFTILKVNDVTNAYHQDDSVKWQFDIKTDASYTINLSENFFDYLVNHDSLMTISEKEHEPKILTEKEVQKIKKLVTSRLTKELAGIS